MSLFSTVSRYHTQHLTDFHPVERKGGDRFHLAEIEFSGPRDTSFTREVLLCNLRDIVSINNAAIAPDFIGEVVSARHLPADHSFHYTYGREILPKTIKSAVVNFPVLHMDMDTPMRLIRGIVVPTPHLICTPELLLHGFRVVTRNGRDEGTAIAARSLVSAQALRPQDSRYYRGLLQAAA